MPARDACNFVDSDATAYIGKQAELNGRPIPLRVLANRYRANLATDSGGKADAGSGNQCLMSEKINELEIATAPLTFDFPNSLKPQVVA